MQANFHRSRLVRLLAPTGPSARRGGAASSAAHSRRDLAQGLGDWLGAFDAVTLHSAHQKAQTLLERDAPPPDPAALAEAAASVQAAIARLHQALVDKLGAQLRAPLPWSDPPPPLQQLVAAPFVRRHLELQRQMEQQIEAAHTPLRQQISRLSPRWHALALLDVVLNQSVAPREQRLLAQTTQWLERRFTAHRDEHARRCQAHGLTDDPATWRQPNGWLTAFENDWQALALAELEHRLLPLHTLGQAVSMPSTR